MFYKNLYSTANKIKLLRELEKEAKIGIFDINFELTDKKLDINPILLQSIKLAFRTTKEEPKTYKELLPFYINRIENIVGNIKLFDKKRIQENKVRKTIYTYNTKTIQNIFELHGLKYSSHYGIHEDILKKFSDIITIANEDTNNIIDNDEINVDVPIVGINDDDSYDETNYDDDDDDDI